MSGSRLTNDSDVVKKIGIDVPETVLRKIEAAARAEGMQRAPFIRRIVSRYIQGALVEVEPLAVLAALEERRNANQG